MAAAAASASSATTSHLRKTVKASDLAPASVTVFEVSDAKKVLLVKTADGNIHATSSKCPHYGLPLGKATVAENCISCPFHGAKFDVRTGDIEDGPSFDKIATYSASVGSDGYVYVDLPEGDASADKVMPSYCSSAGSSDSRHFVIVGAGTSSHAAIEELRSSGFTGKITVIARDEPGSVHHFDRTALSKNLAAASTPAKLSLRPDEWWADRDVTLQLGKEVTAIDAATRTITMSDATTVTYDACLCATSGPARTFRKDRAEGFSIEGAELGNIFVCRDPSDSAAIHSAVAAKPGARVVVVGSSFIGMEVSGFLAKHHDLASKGSIESLTVVGMEAEPFERVLGAEFGAVMRALHEKHGVSFEMSNTITAFHPSESDAGSVGSVSLKSGTKLQADVCIIGAGMIPAVKYLEATAGVKVLPRGGGVLVSETLEAAPGLYACGDIARFPYAQHVKAGDSKAESAKGDGTVRVEHWNVAIAQGRVAARNMLGGSEAFDAVPFFWSGQLGHNIRYAGHAESWDEVVIQGDKSAPQISAYYCKNDQVAAVATLQDDPQAVAARDLMQMSRMPTAEQIKAVAKFDLRAHLQKVSVPE